MALLALTAMAGPAGARSTIDFGSDSGGGESTENPPPYLQCVPFAREATGVRIYGDAHTWWDQAEGRYARGSRPKVGAVMAFRPYGNSELGHVAAVSRIIDPRTVLISHANWSPIDGRRGQIERNVKAVDVSEDNDWSRVRVWYAPIEGLGTTAWPLSGFIYNRAPGSEQRERPVITVAKTSAEKTRLVNARTRNDAAARAQLAGHSDPIGEIIRQSRPRMAGR